MIALAVVRSRVDGTIVSLKPAAASTLCPRDRSHTRRSCTDALVVPKPRPIAWGVYTIVTQAEREAVVR